MQALNGSQSTISSDHDCDLHFQPDISAWVELSFCKRECVKFVATNDENPTVCCCGQSRQCHSEDVASVREINREWDQVGNVVEKPTDAFGSINFLCESRQSNKAQYLRLSCDTSAKLAFQLLTEKWRLGQPKLVITVHGDNMHNFELNPYLKSVLHKGLVGAAKTTNGWILTGGINKGVTRHVGDALESKHSLRIGDRVMSIGIAPWGLVENRQSLIGWKKVVRSEFSSLNNRHTCFLLADDGTVGHSGTEMKLRRQLENYISTQSLKTQINCSIPVVCLVVEGNVETINTVLEYVTSLPPVPVVVVEGSGRAADLIAFTYEHAMNMGEYFEIGIGDEKRQELLFAIQYSFRFDPFQAENLLAKLVQCVEKKNLITIFRPLAEDQSLELDRVILSAIFRSGHLPAVEQLCLALAWNRVDIARSEIFAYSQDWVDGALEEAMMEALKRNQVDFVKLLLEEEIQMKTFLTKCRLMDLYNYKEPGKANILKYIVRNVRTSHNNEPYSLNDIGLLMNKLMGGAYRSSYISDPKENDNQVVRVQVEDLPPVANGTLQCYSKPFNELLVWSVLTKRQSMAKLMWQHGEEALAKALVASKLYQAMASETAWDYDWEVKIHDDLLSNEAEFKREALELLDFCYRQDENLAQQLLTCELSNWSSQTCLTLAFMCRHHEMLAHPCSQLILNDLWLGGLRTRRYAIANMRILLAFLTPFLITCMKFKWKRRSQNRVIFSHDHESPSSPAIEMQKTTGNESNVGEQTRQLLSGSSINATGNNGLAEEKNTWEIYSVPIAKFLSWSISYFFFLILFTGTLLIRTPAMPEWNEWYVVIYLATFAVEKCREIATSEPVNFGRKFSVWASNLWNCSDAVFIIFFFIGMILRLQSNMLNFGRVIYCLDIVYWYLRVLVILRVSRFHGPFLTMINQMMKRMVYYVTLMVVVLMSYGVFRQSVLYPQEEFNWFLVRDVFFKPYFMIYGELFIDDIASPCGNGTQPGGSSDTVIPSCVTGRWLNPLLMSFYLLVANILLLNLLIAIFNSIFERMDDNSRQIWKFNRFAVVVEYDKKPTLPPPFIIFSHLRLVFKQCCGHTRGVQPSFDRLKVILKIDDLERVFDFEEESMEGLVRERNAKENETTDQLIRRNGERLDSFDQVFKSIQLQLKTLHSEIKDCQLARIQYVQSAYDNTSPLSSATSKKSSDDKFHRETDHLCSQIKPRSDTSNQLQDSNYMVDRDIVSMEEKLQASEQETVFENEEEKSRNLIRKRKSMHIEDEDLVSS